MEIMNTQFDRDYLLTFKNPDGPFVQVGGLRCTFDVELYVDNKEKTDKGKISVYNLKEDTLKQLGYRFGYLKLVAGYKNNMATIVEGDVISVSTSRQGTDRVTTFELAPNFINMAIKKISYHFPENVNLFDVFVKIAQNLELGVPTKLKGNTWQDITIPYGLPIYGTGKMVLDELCNSYSLEWKTQDGNLIITDRYGLVDGRKETAILLTKDTGMIDIPYIATEEIGKSVSQALDKRNEQFIYKAPSLKKDGTPRKQNKYQVRRYSLRVKALLNPHIKPNSLIKVQTTDGRFDDYARVRCVKFNGDTRGTEWYMDIYGDTVEATEYE